MVVAPQENDLARQSQLLGDLGLAKYRVPNNVVKETQSSVLNVRRLASEAPRATFRAFANEATS